jgi:hypothetical protein
MGGNSLDCVQGTLTSESILLVAELLFQQFDRTGGEKVSRLSHISKFFWQVSAGQLPEQNLLLHYKK